jgi:CopG family transcriptional regulator/antitoxin EndoAI
MSESKKLVISLSDTLCSEFDEALKQDCKKRSEFIREAIILYIEEKKKIHLIEEMKNGYMEMAELNLQLCEMGLCSDICELKEYEVKLSESDLPDDDGGEKRRYILC